MKQYPMRGVARFSIFKLYDFPINVQISKVTEPNRIDSKVLHVLHLGLKVSKLKTELVRVSLKLIFLIQQQQNIENC